MKKYKKIFLGIGTIGTVMTPIAAVISCGAKGSDDTDDPITTTEKLFINQSVPVNMTDKNLPKGSLGEEKWEAVSTFKKDDDVTEWFDAQIPLDLPIGVYYKVIVKTPYSEQTHKLGLSATISEDYDYIENGGETTELISHKEFELKEMKYEEQAIKAIIDLIESMRVSYSENFTKKDENGKALPDNMQPDPYQIYPYPILAIDPANPTPDEILYPLRANGWNWANASHGFNFTKFSSPIDKYRLLEMLPHIDALFGFSNLPINGKVKEALGDKYKPTNEVPTGDNVTVDTNAHKILFKNYPDLYIAYDHNAMTSVYDAFNREINGDNTITDEAKHALKVGLKGIADELKVNELKDITKNINADLKAFVDASERPLKISIKDRLERKKSQLSTLNKILFDLTEKLKLVETEKEKLQSEVDTEIKGKISEFSSLIIKDDITEVETDKINVYILYMQNIKKSIIDSIDYSIALKKYNELEGTEKEEASVPSEKVKSSSKAKASALKVILGNDESFSKKLTAMKEAIK